MRDGVGAEGRGLRRLADDSPLAAVNRPCSFSRNNVYLSLALPTGWLTHSPLPCHQARLALLSSLSALPKLLFYHILPPDALVTSGAARRLAELARGGGGCGGALGSGGVGDEVRTLRPHSLPCLPSMPMYFWLSSGASAGLVRAPLPSSLVGSGGVGDEVRPLQPLRLGVAYGLWPSLALSRRNFMSQIACRSARVVLAAAILFFFFFFD